MKKNRMMRLASVLLILTLLSTSVISGTFAKYTTSATSSDSARVAYWGFQTTNSMDITGLFTDTYGSTVNSVNDADVIAPGTSNSKTFTFAWDEAVSAYGSAVSVTGPEVTYDFTVSVDGSFCDPNIAANPNIQWKLDNGNWGDWGTLLASIKALSGDASGTKQYGPNQLPSAFTAQDDTHTISWQWVFETKDANNIADANQDLTDTNLGNAAELEDVYIIITINATQVD